MPDIPSASLYRHIKILADSSILMVMEKQGQWLLCPYCHGKTRVWIREDTVLHNFLLFCPECKREELIDLAVQNKDGGNKWKN